MRKKSGLKTVVMVVNKFCSGCFYCSTFAGFVTSYTIPQASTFLGLGSV